MTHHHDQTKVSKVSVDINQYQKDNFERIADIPYIINNDDIFYYNDWDDKQSALDNKNPNHHKTLKSQLGS